MVVAGLVGAVAALYGIGYVQGPAASRTSWSAMALFLLALQLVPAAADAVSFLLCWELMAVASTVLLLADHAHRAAGAFGCPVVLGDDPFQLRDALVGVRGPLQLLGTGPGSRRWRGCPPTQATASVAFALLIVGFASKAGIVPLHVWLPRAHPEAPSHVSAVMSAAMVKMGVYGALLVSIRLLPGGPAWWGLLLIALGAVSAVYGILQASVATDLKRMLAYSTSENVGLMYLALGAGLLLRSYGVAEPADSAIAACLLLVVGHAAFKTTLFLGAGSILHATGERDLDRLGGLGARMPVTSAAFGIGALGAAALPVTVGLRGRVGAPAVPDPRTRDAGSPRRGRHAGGGRRGRADRGARADGVRQGLRDRVPGPPARRRERPPLTRAGWGCASRWASLLRRWSSWGWPRARWPRRPPLRPACRGWVRSGWWGIDLSGIDALLDPVALTVLAVALAIPVILVSARLARRQPRRRVDLTWGCGGVRLSPRMQYTATSYAEPLSRVFDDALRPERDVLVTHAGESRYLVERVQFRQQRRRHRRGRRPTVRASAGWTAWGCSRAACRTAASTATSATPSSRCWPSSWW